MLPLVVQIERTAARVADTCAFNRSPVRIGRNALNDLQLEEGFVSQWHAVVRLHEQSTTYLDLGSTNRTLINGKAVDRNLEVVIEPDTDVRIGTLRLHFFRGEAPEELFGRRRKSAFGKSGAYVQGGDMASTLFLGDRALEAMRAQLTSAASARPEPARFDANASAKLPVVPVRSAKLAEQQPQAPAQSERPAIARTGDAMLDGYRSYRAGFGDFFAAVRRELEGTEPARREEQVLLLQQRFPELVAEPSFREYLKEVQIDPLRVGHIDMEDWLRRLTDQLFPPKGLPINVAMAMERVGEILEVFSQTFIELRRAHEQFCREMSLERHAEGSTMQSTEDARVLLAYLLNPHKDGAGRTTELTRALADFAVHPVALVGAVVEGARHVLEDLGPQALQKAPDPRPGSPVLLQERAIDKFWPYPARKLWRRFLTLHRELSEGDHFTRELFGRAFARHYYSVIGGGEARPPSSR